MRFRPSLPAVILMMTPAVCLFLVVLSVLYGAKDISADTVWQALVSFDSGNVDHQIIRSSRLPRALGALMIGAFLAVSGALMQGMTRNYLASPSIMGVADGSVFAVTIVMILLPHTSSYGLIFSSMLGSLIGALIVFGLAWLVPGGLSPVKLAILGTIVGTFLSGISSAISVYFQISQNISFWYNARLHSMDPTLIKLSLPFAAIGLLLAIGLSRFVTLLALGEDTAKGLGVHTWLIRVLCTIAVVIMTGIAVALAGKIAFVGLIIPHIARFFAGTDYRRIVPVSGALGGMFLLTCDIGARFMNYPFETPVGVVTSLIGVPFFLYLIKRKGGKSHV